MIDKKILLISHLADPDGTTPVIFARLVFKEVESLLLDVKEVDEYVLKAIDNIDSYDEVHIVDLCMSYEVAKKIDNDEKLKNKFLVYDHHISRLELNEFSFINVIVERNNRKESGTSLYYEYLTSISDNEILHKPVCKELTEEVRIVDTYDFKCKEEEKAKDLNLLFTIFGREDYISYFSNYVKTHEHFEYGKDETLLISVEKKRMQRYLEYKEKNFMRAILDGHKVGIVYSERYRSELGTYLAKKYDDLDYIILINVSASISYRGADKVDLSVITGKLGGGGHKNAAGSPLPEGLLEKITRYIYPDIEILEGNDVTNA